MEKFSEFKAMSEGTKEECAELFQRVVFGSRLQREPDTPMEADLWQQMQDWIAYPDLAIGKYSHLFQTLKKCKPYYKAQLMPDARIAFRGTKVNILNIITKKWKLSPLTMRDPHTHQKQPWFYIDVTYKAKSRHQSWTKSRHTAYEFVRSQIFSGQYNAVGPKEMGVVLETPVSKDFIFNSKTSNRLGIFGVGATINGQHGEFEMVRTVNKPIRVKAHFSKQILTTMRLMHNPNPKWWGILASKIKSFGFNPEEF